jgi:hypothetical protein
MTDAARPDAAERSPKTGHKFRQNLCLELIAHLFNRCVMASLAANIPTKNRTNEPSAASSAQMWNARFIRRHRLVFRLSETYGCSHFLAIEEAIAANAKFVR